MNFPYFLAKRITGQGQRVFSGLIVRVAIVGIALGLSAMILSVAVLKGFKQAIVSKQRGFFGDLTIFNKYWQLSEENQPLHLPSGTVDSLTQLRGGVQCKPIATKPAVMKAHDEVEGVVLKGIDKRYDQRFLKGILVKGDTISFKDSVLALQQVLISAYTANRMRLDVGDHFIMYFVQEPLRKRKFVIAGIYNMGVEEVDKTFVIGDMGVIKRLNNWLESDVGGYQVRFGNFDKLSLMRGRVMKLLPQHVGTITVPEQYPEVFQWLDMLDVNTQIILILMIGVGAINMISALLIMILERTSMIGILKALGFPNTGIRKVFIYHATTLIGFGLLLGNVLGLGIYFFQDQTHFFKLDEAAYYVAYVPVSISWWEVVGLNVGLLVICVLALLIPSGLISRLSPIKIIRWS
ncbi:lipoprotein-releasing system permease protein [bacterium A37T11]|nr:lipoprotein-releasing system permease protein [bacterium A37T11]